MLQRHAARDLVELRPRWLALAEADALFGTLRDELAWEQRTIRMFAREVLEPRLVAWYGDAGAVYTYSGRRNEPRPWHPALAALRDRLARETGHAYNSVLANLYRDGHDAMGLHADREPELGESPFIASISLGATRRFVIRHRRDKADGLDLDLPHGSLLLMRGELQRDHRHGVPRQPSVTGARINLTFRRVEGLVRGAGRRRS